MKISTFDAILRTFCRVQSTIVAIMLYGLLIQNDDYSFIILSCGVITDILRYIFRLGSILGKFLGIILCVFGFIIMISFVIFDYRFLDVQSEEKFLNLRSAFLRYMQNEGDLALILNLTLSMGVIHMGIFLLFSNNHSTLAKKQIRHVDLSNVAASKLIIIISGLFFFIFLSILVLYTGIFNKIPPHNLSLPENSWIWRFNLAIPFLLSCISILLNAVLSFLILNSVAIRRKLP